MYRTGSTRQRSGRSSTSLLLVLIGAAAMTACQPIQPAATESLGESVLQLGDAVSALQQENAMLQDQIDSLRIAVARQDTSLRRFANLAGMPLP